MGAGAARCAAASALYAAKSRARWICSAVFGAGVSALTALLKDFQWKTLFWERRTEVLTHMRCFLFGHGLMEKALRPYQGMTGKGVLLSVSPQTLALPLAAQLTHADHLLADLIADGQQLLQPRDLAPVPVLGFPRFTRENECAAYYDDQRYFRPGRSAVC